MEATLPTGRRVSPVLFAIIMVAFVLSLASIYAGVQNYVNNDTINGSLYLTIGVTTLAVTTYMMFQTRRRTLRLGLDLTPMSTTLLCQKCGFKNLRDFQRGDYIFKHMEEPCPKCSEKSVKISSIFREFKEKPKETGYT